VHLFDDTPLVGVHNTIQAAMGWRNYHLWAFRRERQVVATNNEDDPAGVRAGRKQLKSFLRAQGQELEYVYDFGDWWRHRLTHEGVVEREGRKRYPRCVDGARACPPEDCGGVPGYERVVRTPWSGRYAHYDPERFDLRATNWHVHDLTLRGGVRC